MSNINGPHAIFLIVWRKSRNSVNVDGSEVDVEVVCISLREEKQIISELINEDIAEVQLDEVKKWKTSKCT